MSRGDWWRAAAGLLLVLAVAAPASALPTMIRLGYADCAACHVSPQGGGLLNGYGKSIDEAQSLRSSEYKPSGNPLVRALSIHGRVTQDLRTVMQEQTVWTPGKGGDSVFRPRLMYRNVTQIGSGFRVSAVVTGESESAPRPALKYDPAMSPSSLFVNTALLHYRPSKSIELAAGRDQLPSGINVPDLAPFIKSRNRLGYYDAPTQVKLFVSGKRFAVVPFVFAPGGREARGERESGAGTLAEFDLIGHGRTVVGTTLLHGRADNGTRQTVGGYARLGFGKWGILAEHDVTDRTRDTVTTGSFRQQATYAQVFWAVREWLVASAIAERLTVQRPFRERLAAGRLEVAARLTNQASVSLGVRVQRNLLTGRQTPSLSLQAALKSAQ
jgi:hypothetical protein